MVASPVPSWMRTGYGHSLLAADAPRLLISFEEFAKRPETSLPIADMGSTYTPKPKEQEDVKQPQP